MMYTLLTVCAVALFSSAQGRSLVITDDPNTLKCDPNGQIFLLLPSYSRCNEFFTCDNGKEVSMECARGTIFDFPLQTCNHPWATQCWLRKSESSEESNSQETSQETTDSPISSEETDGSQSEDSSESESKEDSIGGGEGSGDFEGSGSGDVEWTATEEDKPADADFVENKILDCSNANRAALQVSYKGDCQRYWRCVNGEPRSSYCSDGLFFNQATMQCDHEANVVCEVNHEYELEGEYIVYRK